MVYKSNFEQMKDYFFNVIYPNMDVCGVDYKKTISEISLKLSIKKEKVEDFFKDLVESGKLQEIRIIELSKEEIIKREIKRKELEKETEELIKWTS